MLILVDRLNALITHDAMESSDTLSHVINRLRNQGYADVLNRADDNTLWLHPDAYRVDDVYRFSGVVNPNDAAILYVLSSDQYNVKGVLINGYGLSADPVVTALEPRFHPCPAE